MLFERIESKGLAHYSYLIGDQRQAGVTDPRWAGDTIETVTPAQFGWRLQA